MRPIITFLKDPREITQGIVRRLFANRMANDKKYLSLLYFAAFWKRMNWKDPSTFNEKMTWLKIYDRRPEYTTMVDKYAVKSYVAASIGNEYVVKNYAAADRWEDINWDLMPNQFVVKCTQGGGTFVCHDKATFDFEGTRKVMEVKMKSKVYNISREWPYKNLKSKIIVDELLDDHTGEVLRDYKWWCFNGKPTYMYCTVKSKKVYENFYDMDFKPVNINHGFERHKPEFERPECFDEMKRLATELSKGIPFVRVDFFMVNRKVFFGELTFFDWGGHRPFKNGWDNKLGALIELPKK